MGRFFHYPYSEKLIQHTLGGWGPIAAKRGEQINRADAEEILRNLDNFFDALWNMDQAHRKRTIESYYCEKGVEVAGFLAEDLKAQTFSALRHVEYAIDNLAGIPGMAGLLRDVARITTTGNEGERIYENNLTQLHAISFVHKDIGYQIVEVESSGRRVLAPGKTGAKSCDIRACANGGDVYLECKDASSETLSLQEHKGAEYFNPMDESEIKTWIENECRKADKKGAAHLICRVPVWVSGWEQQEQEFYAGWVRRVFQVIAQPNPCKVIIPKPRALSANFRSAYIIKRFGHLELAFPDEALLNPV